MPRERILFLCTHNSARSQLAESLMRELFGDRFEVFSAGTEATSVKEPVFVVLREIGIDASAQFSKSLEDFGDLKIDILVTVCDNARELCPIFPNVKRSVHIGFKDPSDIGKTREERLNAFRSTRNEIADWLRTTFGQPFQ